jgi:hypothetical protein
MPRLIDLKIAWARKRQKDGCVCVLYVRVSRCTRLIIRLDPNIAHNIWVQTASILQCRMHVNADNYSSNMHLLHVNADGMSSWSAFGLSSWWLEYLIGINLESVSWPTDSASYHFIMRLATSSALNPTIRNSLLASCIFSKHKVLTKGRNHSENKFLFPLLC